MGGGYAWFPAQLVEDSLLKAIVVGHEFHPLTYFKQRFRRIAFKHNPMLCYGRMDSPETGSEITQSKTTRLIPLLIAFPTRSYMKLSMNGSLATAE